jgi:hypothetical protein
MIKANTKTSFRTRNVVSNKKWEEMAAVAAADRQRVKRVVGTILLGSKLKSITSM